MPYALLLLKRRAGNMLKLVAIVVSRARMVSLARARAERARAEALTTPNQQARAEKEESQVARKVHLIKRVRESWSCWRRC
jgi:hypothetical protein